MSNDASQQPMLEVHLGPDDYSEASSYQQQPHMVQCSGSQVAAMQQYTALPRGMPQFGGYGQLAGVPMGMISGGVCLEGAAACGPVFQLPGHVMDWIFYHPWNTEFLNSTWQQNVRPDFRPDATTDYLPPSLDPKDYPDFTNCSIAPAFNRPSFNQSPPYWYSSGKSLRRDPFLYFYLPWLCPYRNYCPNIYCILSHTNEELSGHPLLFRSQACDPTIAKHGSDTSKCSFIHEGDEPMVAGNWCFLWESQWLGWRRFGNTIAEYLESMDPHGRFSFNKRDLVYYLLRTWQRHLNTSQRTILMNYYHDLHCYNRSASRPKCIFETRINNQLFNPLNSFEALLSQFDAIVARIAVLKNAHIMSVVEENVTTCWNWHCRIMSLFLQHPPLTVHPSKGPIPQAPNPVLHGAAGSGSIVHVDPAFSVRLPPLNPKPHAAVDPEKAFAVKARLQAAGVVKESGEIPEHEDQKARQDGQRPSTTTTGHAQTFDAHPPFRPRNRNSTNRVYTADVKQRYNRNANAKAAESQSAARPEARSVEVSKQTGEPKYKPPERKPPRDLPASTGSPQQVRADSDSKPARPRNSLTADSKSVAYKSAVDDNKKPPLQKRDGPTAEKNVDLSQRPRSRQSLRQNPRRPRSRQVDIAPKAPPNGS